MWLVGEALQSAEKLLKQMARAQHRIVYVNWQPGQSLPQYRNAWWHWQPLMHTPPDNDRKYEIEL